MSTDNNPTGDPVFITNEFWHWSDTAQQFDRGTVVFETREEFGGRVLESLYHEDGKNPYAESIINPEQVNIEERVEQRRRESKRARRAYVAYVANTGHDYQGLFYDSENAYTTVDFLFTDSLGFVGVKPAGFTRFIGKDDAAAAGLIHMWNAGIANADAAKMRNIDNVASWFAEWVHDTAPEYGYSTYQRVYAATGRIVIRNHRFSLSGSALDVVRAENQRRAARVMHWHAAEDKAAAVAEILSD